MAVIKSHNTENITLERQLFLPSLIEMLLYILTSVILLLASNVKAIWDYLSFDPAGQHKAAALINGSGNETSAGILGSSLQGRLGQMIIWGVVGVAIYVVIWFLRNTIINLRNDLVADEFVHPRSYNRSRYWQSIIARKAFFGFMSIVFIGFIYLLFKLFPVLSSMFFFGTHQLDQSHITQLVGSLLALAVLLHVLVVLARMTINSWRYIYSDL